MRWPIPLTQPLQSQFPLQPMHSGEGLYENLCNSAGQPYSIQEFSPFQIVLAAAGR